MVESVRERRVTPPACGECTCDDHGVNDTPTDGSCGSSVICAASGCSTSGAGPARRRSRSRTGRDRHRGRRDRRTPRARPRARAEQAEVKVEWRTGDLADLAFLRAESIDAAFSAYAVAEVDDAARLFRQVAAGAQAQRAFVFSYEHPMSLCLDASGVVVAARTSIPARSTCERDGESGAGIHVRDVGEVFTELGARRLPRRHDPRARPVDAGRQGARHHRLARPQGRRLIGFAACGFDALLAAQRVEARVGLVLADRALVETDLEQEVERLAHDPPGATPRCSMTCRPSSGGRMASSSSCSRSSAMRRSSSSMRRCSARARFWLRVVQSHRCRWLSWSSRSPASRT